MGKLRGFTISSAEMHSRAVAGLAQGMSPVTAPGAVAMDQAKPSMTGFFAHLSCAQKKAALEYDGPESFGPQDPDERPGDYLEYGGTPHPSLMGKAASRYPDPGEAELVTLWKRSGRVVMSVTANGKTHDFYMPPGRLAYLIKEVAEQLAENTLIQ